MVVQLQHQTNKTEHSCISANIKQEEQPRPKKGISSICSTPFQARKEMRLRIGFSQGAHHIASSASTTATSAPRRRPAQVSCSRGAFICSLNLHLSHRLKASASTSATGALHRGAGLAPEQHAALRSSLRKWPRAPKPQPGHVFSGQIGTIVAGGCGALLLGMSGNNAGNAGRTRNQQKSAEDSEPPSPSPSNAQHAGNLQCVFFSYTLATCRNVVLLPLP